MLDGVWCEGGGVVYEEFYEKIHIHKGPMPVGWERWHKVRGIDFGYTNPFVCLRPQEAVAQMSASAEKRFHITAVPQGRQGL